MSVEPNQKVSETRQELSESQQLLLMRFADGECGLWGRVQAKWLLRGRATARDFVESLRTTDQHISELLTKRDRESRAGELDLWAGIEQRILQEERSAIYTSRSDRKSGQLTGKDQPRSAGFSEWTRGLSWAGTGAAVAAVCTLLITGQGVFDGGSLAGKGAPQYVVPSLIASTATLTESSMATEALPVGAPQIMQSSIPSTFEVDWMRGNGRVKLYNDAEQRAPMIWVRKRTRRDDPARTSPNGFAREPLQSEVDPRRPGTALPLAEFPERFR
jgi:hypothetical protein